MRIVLAEGEGGDRMDRFLAEYLEETSRSQIQKAIHDGAILLNGHRGKPKDLVQEGDCLQIDLSYFAIDPIVGEDLPLEILFEDRDLIVVNKPAGMIVHPTSVIRHGTLVNALLGRKIPLSRLGGEERPGIVHRLDAQTTGALVVAKTDLAFTRLKEQFKEHTVEKRYMALVEGRWQVDHLSIESLLGRDPNHRQKISSRPEGKRAISIVTSKDWTDRVTYVEVIILTGRTHQIRVHVSEAGHPVLGDDLYGFRKQRFSFSHQMLHARELRLLHPITGEPMTFLAEPDEEMKRAFEKFGFSWKQKTE